MLKGENKNFFYFALFILHYADDNASMKFLTNKFPIIPVHKVGQQKKKRNNNNNNNDYYYYFF